MDKFSVFMHAAFKSRTGSGLDLDAAISFVFKKSRNFTTFQCW